MFYLARNVVIVKKDVCGTQHTHTSLRSLKSLAKILVGMLHQSGVSVTEHILGTACVWLIKDTMARDTVQVLHNQTKKTQHEMFERLAQVLRTFAFACVPCCRPKMLGNVPQSQQQLCSVSVPCWDSIQEYFSPQQAEVQYEFPSTR